jgi:hypothetical protein
MERRRPQRIGRVVLVAVMGAVAAWNVRSAASTLPSELCQGIHVLADDVGVMLEG